MNDPNKKIDIDKSSLLSLKAELLRKQAEVNKAKTFTSIDDFVPKKDPKPVRGTAEDGPSNSKTVEIEDSAELSRSKQILESKAKYYDRMIASGGSLNTDENCLVMFNEKKQTVRRHSTSSDDFDSDSGNEKYKSKHPDDEWVEYTDCLGRTRKCLKRDLVDFKKRDQALSDVMNPQSGESEEEGEIIGPMPTASLSEQDIGERFLQMKDQWEKQEADNLDKDFVHYQDVLFNEARTHGVGYYEFSKDQEERAKQQEELITMRDSTLEAQKEREKLRKARDKIINDRVKAAKARQRARLGLPPEEEVEENTEDDMYDKSEELMKKRQEEKEKRRREKDDKRREKERLQHVRPWDEGKSGVSSADWKPRIEKEPMTQEQWNAKKRAERDREFAPVPEKAKEKESPRLDTFFVDTVGNLEEEVPPETDKSLFFTTKKKVFKRRNYEPHMTESKKSKIDVTRIRNELSDSSSDEEKRVRNEIAPPGTYEVALSSSKKKSAAPADLEKSIEAGLKFLRNQSDKAGPSTSTKNKWTTNADY